MVGSAFTALADELPAYQDELKNRVDGQAKSITDWDIPFVDDEGRGLEAFDFPSKLLAQVFPATNAL